MNSILNIEVSCFRNCKSAIPKNVNLLSWLTNEKYRDKVENLRTIQDENLQKTIKASLPAITPSGVFSYRAEKDLIEHTGFLAFDIDKKDNTHISNFDSLKTEISHIASVAYCGLSVRGKGFWGLIPIPKSTPDEHKQRFAALSKFFKDYGVNLDESGKDVCRLRIYSIDPEAYFNHNATLYTLILKPQIKSYNRPAFSDTRERAEAIISQIKENRIDITQNYEAAWFGLAAAFANEFGEGGRGYFHSVSMFHPKYSVQDTDSIFNACLKKQYEKWSIGSFFHIAESYGIKLKREAVTVQPISKPIEKAIPENKPLKLPDQGPIIKTGIWDQEITDLQQFFKVIPSGPIHLNKWELITDPALFIKSHIDIVKAQNGNKRYEPYLNRLNELKIILS